VDGLTNQLLTGQTDISVPFVVEPVTRRLRVLHVVNGEYYAGAERVHDSADSFGGLRHHGVSFNSEFGSVTESW
jgi:hypothetical protein